jgi:hypothetical protein
MFFSVRYSHVPAHQDAHEAYDTLHRLAQLNHLSSGTSKEVVRGWVGEDILPQRVFPLESLAVYVDSNMLPTCTGDKLRFWAHKQLAESVFIKLGLLLAVDGAVLSDSLEANIWCTA